MIFQVEYSNEILNNNLFVIVELSDIMFTQQTYAKDSQNYLTESAFSKNNFDINASERTGSELTDVSTVIKLIY